MCMCLVEVERWFSVTNDLVNPSHAVNGGQGMNTGLSDAFNLIWRLNLAIKFPDLPSALRDDLISSYDIERRATATEVVDVASKLVRSTLANAQSYVELIEKNAGFITGMGVRYDGLESPLVVESQRGIFKAGERCPDLWLQDGDKRSSCRLYRKIVYGQYTLLLINYVAATLPINVKEGALLQALSLVGLAASNSGVTVSSSSNSSSHDSNGSSHQDTFGCSWVKNGDQYAVLIRPDCYIEYADECDQVVDYLRRRIPGIVS